MEQAATASPLPPPELKLGAFTRRVVAVGEARRAFAALEDDFHHFHAEIAHDGERVTDVRALAHRFPHSTCPEALDGLKRFVGLALEAASTGIDATWQCTHAYELVRLAMSQARRGGVRTWEMRIPDRVARRTRAEIRRDGELVLAWDIEGRFVMTPGPFEKFDIYGTGGMPKGLDADAREAALLLRRATWLSIARGIYAPTVEAAKTPGGLRQKFSNPMSGACYSYQPSVEARRISLRRSNNLDFTDRPEGLLAEVGRDPVRPVFLLNPQ